MKKFKRIPDKYKNAIRNEVKLMVAAHRDSLWNRWETCATPQAVDPTKFTVACNEGYYGEAFGVIRALVVLGYGYFGPDNLDAVKDNRSDIPEHNLKWFFQQIVQEYLDEEGFYDKSCSAEKCHQLLDKYRNKTQK
jgi:hypothetical protein